MAHTAAQSDMISLSQTHTNTQLQTNKLTFIWIIHLWYSIHKQIFIQLVRWYPNPHLLTVENFHRSVM